MKGWTFLAAALVSTALFWNQSSPPDNSGNLALSFVDGGGTVQAQDQHGRGYSVDIVGVRDELVPGTSPAKFARTITLGVRIPGSQAVALAAETAGGCRAGASYGLSACLTQYYTHFESGVAVEKYVAVWSRADPQVALSRGTIKAGVRARCVPTSCNGTLDDAEEFTVESPVSDKPYPFKLRWSGKFVDTSNRGYQCANSGLSGNAEPPRTTLNTRTSAKGPQPES
ncbi:hypothetical protein [Pseudonocardia acaciae]|uniref:hypothetical protein n=1 Tax=Pseudonocardia acaciae TaxID=551276 RepID=UPI0012EE572A|nr:hypothetical protein [Pseudonocardia acaciae]